MIAFSFRSLTFKPPLATPRRFIMGVELADGSSQNTEPFTYSPQTNIAALSETLEFLVKDPQKGNSFQLEILEFDERAQRWFRIGKETFSLNKLYSIEAVDLTLPSIYGADAIVDSNIELSDEFKDSIFDDDTSILNSTLNSLEDPTFLAQNSTPKKRSKRERLEKIFHLEKLNPFKNATLYHELIFAITPLVDAKEYLIDFFTWKNPKTTFVYSTILTMITIYGRYLLGFGLLLFSIFGKKAIPYIMKPRTRPTKVKGKLHIYKKNFVFVKDVAQNLIFGYDIYRKAAEDPERLIFLQLLFILKRFAPLLAIVIFTVRLKYLLLMGYWSFLIYNTPKGKAMFANIFMKALIFLEKYKFLSFPQNIQVKKIIENAANAANATVLKSPKSEASTQPTLILSREEVNNTPPKTRPQRLFAEKVFIIYENQRWWPGKGWRSELLPGERPSWSDALGQIEINKDEVNLPGPNWHWETEWGYVIGEKTDHEGWEYASRFKKFDDPNRKKSLIHGVRRRKWLRKCICFDE